jgi:predicted DNA-binding transcriptional regulator YafY
MDRNARLDLVLRTLRDRPGVTAAELAEQIGTSVRSLFRDVSYLRERGYPIESSRGRGGGLRLHPNWGLGRVLLSTEEALGVLLSLALGERLGLPMLGSGIGQARRKLVSAFPSSDRRRLNPLRERVLVAPPAAQKVVESYGEPSPVAVRSLQSAFVHERMITAVYVREDGLQSERRVEPHAILLSWPAWYLLGFDHLRGEVRTFRLDRFRSVREEAEGFRPRPRAMIEAIWGPDCDDPSKWRL